MKSEIRKGIIKEFAVHFLRWEHSRLGTEKITCFNSYLGAGEQNSDEAKNEREEEEY